MSDFPAPPCALCERPSHECRCYDCSTCKGKGAVNPLTAPNGFFCAGTTDCPDCNGTGEVP